MAACDVLQEEVAVVPRARQLIGALWATVDDYGPVDMGRVVKLVEELLELGPPSLLDVRDEGGETALSLAAGCYVHPDMIRYLLVKGADPALHYPDEDDLRADYEGETVVGQLLGSMWCAEGEGDDALYERSDTAYGCLCDVLESREVVLAQIRSAGGTAGEWRPDGAGAYPSCWRGALRTLLVLARGQQQVR
ncbi:MAG: hypothetical protein JKY65_09300 [Planctomycetes bacterium]|nr:hypothetical protein [Planctomycetota bacterium]